MNHPEPASALRKVRVLVLDDDRRIARIVNKLLADLGFRRIFEGHDGSEGLRIMHEHAIHLVITDWQMKPMSGIDFIRHVRTHPDSPNRFVPIIMLTGRAEPRDVEVARDTGITEFVVKPFSVRRLVDRIILTIENPRSFILADAFTGPDRRRRQAAPPCGTDRRGIQPEEQSPWPR